MPNEVSIIISTEGLSALADMALAPKQQAYLDELLARNAEGQLSDSETHELDLLKLNIFIRSHLVAKQYSAIYA